MMWAALAAGVLLASAADDVAKLGWMAGSWSHEKDGVVTRETWLAPRDDAMAGAARALHGLGPGGGAFREGAGRLFPRRARDQDDADRGLQPGRPYTAQEVAENAGKVFFADITERTAVSA
jgi:hypothetical protein